VETFNRTVATLETTRSVLIEIPFDQQVARQMFNVDRSQIPELPDRIIAATALYLNVPIISRDREIQVSSLSTIW
jgi:predicted nucleic acid-binding protein